jgi:hypothetical protein
MSEETDARPELPSPTPKSAGHDAPLSGGGLGPDDMPQLKPLMLRCMTYGDVLRQMRVTGCAGRRNHWCAPVLVYRGTKLLLDDEGEMRPWRANADDRRSSDWEMVDDEGKPDATVSKATGGAS